MLFQLAACVEVPWPNKPIHWRAAHQAVGLFEQGRLVRTRETGDDTSVVFHCDLVGRFQLAPWIGPGNAVSKDICILEEFRERGTAVDARVLADPSRNPKRQLKAA